MQGSRRNKIHLQYCRDAGLYTLARIYFINIVVCIFIIIERDTVRRVAVSALLNLVGPAYQLLLPLAAFRCDVIRANKIGFDSVLVQLLWVVCGDATSLSARCTCLYRRRALRDPHSLLVSAIRPSPLNHFIRIVLQARTTRSSQPTLYPSHLWRERLVLRAARGVERVEVRSPIYQISYDNLTIILRQCQSYDRLTTDV